MVLAIATLFIKVDKNTLGDFFPIANIIFINPAI